MAGAMIPPEVLNHKSLFSLLYKIDQDLAEQTRAQRCPSVGVRCIAPTTCESLEVGPRNWQRHLNFALVCAAGNRVAVVACCHLRFAFGAAGSTGRRCCCWSVPCAKGGTRFLLWNDSKGFAGYGDPPSIVGRSISGISSPRAPVTGVCAVT